MKSNLTEDNSDAIGVYAVVNPHTAEFYIGSGVLGARHYEHERRLENGTHPNYKLQKAFKKNQEFHFIGAPIEGGSSREEIRQTALNLEQALIDQFSNDYGFLNIAKDVCAPMFGRKHSEEAILNMSRAQSGKILSEEHKRKQSESAKIRAQTPEFREWASNTHKGKVLSDETRQRMSESMLRKFSEGYVAPALGRPVSEETRNKIGNANRGRKHSLETIEIIKTAQCLPLTVNGVVYPSTRQAADAHGITMNAAYGRLHNSNFPNWKRE